MDLGWVGYTLRTDKHGVKRTRGGRAQPAHTHTRGPPRRQTGETLGETPPTHYCRVKSLKRIGDGSCVKKVPLASLGRESRPQHAERQECHSCRAKTGGTLGVDRGQRGTEDWWLGVYLSWVLGVEAQDGLCQPSNPIIFLVWLRSLNIRSSDIIPRSLTC